MISKISSREILAAIGRQRRQRAARVARVPFPRQRGHLTWTVGDAFATLRPLLRNEQMLPRRVMAIACRGRRVPAA